MDLKLKGRSVLITGASRGIGLAIARMFASEGCALHLAARDPDRLRKVADEIGNTHGVPVAMHACDLSRTADVERLGEACGEVDILVNNAGITRDAMTRKMTDDMWDLVVDVNLKGVFNLTRHVGPHMQANGGGSIINISSIVGVYGNIGQANYAATKAGVIGLSKTWAKEFAMKGGNVRVNAIAPGYVMTDILKTVPQELLDKFASWTMLGRLGQPEEIAKAALFLASDDASYVTGHVLEVNGGMRL
ncbi:MAG TPA: beta-ketoacyl-ACP reductase [Erysipelotrichaceae bacterium]|nr:beta-ketoacyl-ACP reductase [Erysipelotrichaceae bacterium]